MTPRRPGSVRLPAVSLFSNCGAGDLGYAQAGFRFQVLGELERRRLDVASRNHREAVPVPGDLRTTYPEVIAAYRRRMGDQPPALLAACPPCQGMSSAQSRRGQAHDADAGSRDRRNLLVEVVATVATELRPRLVVVENVVAFLTRKVRHPETQSPISAARLLIERLQADYQPFALRADLADFGVPQSRKRSFLVLVRRDEAGLERLAQTSTAPFPAATHGTDAEQPHRTLHDALSELGVSSLDAADEKHAGSGMHRVPVWDARRYQMVSSIPPDNGGSAWDNAACVHCEHGQEVALEAAACPNCGEPLPRPVVRADGEWRLIKGFRNSSYRRMKPDQPAAAITTASGRIGSDNTLHPSENRVLSMLECQHLQTFPSDFEWGNHLEAHGHTSVRAMIGEAVPPQFTQLHGRVLSSLLEGRAPARAIKSSDPRVDGASRLLNLPGADDQLRLS